MAEVWVDDGLFSLCFGKQGDADGHAADEGVEGGGDDFVGGGDAAEDFHALAEVAAEFDFAQFDDALGIHDADLQAFARGRAARSTGRVSAGAAVMLAKRTWA